MVIKERAYQELDKLINSNRYYWGSPMVSAMLWLCLTILNTESDSLV